MSDDIKLNYKINTIPSLTWNWLKMNNDTVALDPEEIPASSAAMTDTVTGMTEELSLSGLTRQSFGSGIFNIANKKMPDTRVETEITEQTEKTSVIHPLQKMFDGNKSEIINITEKKADPIIINLTAKGNTYSAQTIVAEKDSEATVIFVYEDFNADSTTAKSSSATPFTQIISTKIIAKENAKLHIVKVQLLGNNVLQLDDTAFIAEDNAQLQFTQIELGGKHVDSGLHVNLNGYKSSFKSNVAYICKNDQYLDMNHIVYHYGKKSECVMHVNGTLEDSAIKTYRGTIDFKNGCSGSKGNEMEEVLLLSPACVNKSLPVILCDEEDVEGEHGSTIGKLSKEMLFYMQTRGISQAEAEKLLSRAKIQFAANFIPSEEIKQKIIDWLGE